MLSEEELEAEIKRIKENKYEHIQDVQHTESFSSDAYIKGIEYALGKDIEIREFPDINNVEKSINDIRDKLDISKIEIVRGGHPPKYMEFSIIVHKEINSVTEYERIESELRDIARKNEDEGERIYILLRRI